MKTETIYRPENIEQIISANREALKSRAFKPEMSKGRRDPHDRDDILYRCLDPFIADTWKIKQSKSYRRLHYKTQVLADPSNAHIRTRGDHTEEVVENAKMISAILGLNTSLTEAIATGHDIGHVPFGHIGEQVLSQLAGKRLKHDTHGVFVAQHIERKGEGLNLSYETLLGISQHSRGSRDLNIHTDTLDEIAVVMYADKISYLFSDYNDVRRHGLLDKNFKYHSIERLGKSQTERVYTVMAALIEESARKGKVIFSEGETYKLFEDSRQFMYDNVYDRIDWELHSKELEKVYSTIKDIYEDRVDIDPIVPLSLMTDRDIKTVTEWIEKVYPLDELVLKMTSIGEILPQLYNKQYEYWNLDLDWKKEQEDPTNRSAAQGCLAKTG